jgi:hypothetical protein
VNQGDLLCVKCTGEVVTLLSDDGKAELVDVRRGKQTRDGFVYVVEHYLPCELETPELYLNRKAEAYMLNLQMQKSVIGRKIAELEQEVEEAADNPETIPFKARPN